MYSNIDRFIQFGKFYIRVSCIDEILERFISGKHYFLVILNYCYVKLYIVFCFIKRFFRNSYYHGNRKSLKIIDVRRNAMMCNFSHKF